MGGVVKSVTKAAKGIVGGASDAVKKVADVAKDVADPVAQALAVVPNPYQPYAQAYTGIRSTGIGGDYGGFQVGPFTPGAYGGQYGINPFAPSTNTGIGTILRGPMSFAPGPGQAPGSDYGIGNLLNYTSMFAPMGKEVPTGGDRPGPTGTGGPTTGDILTDIGIRLGTNLIRDYADRKQQERAEEELEAIIRAGGGASAFDLETLEKFGAKYGPAVLASVMAKLAYEDQKRMMEQYEADRAAFEKRREAKRSQYAKAERPEVRGAPVTAADVVRRPAMMGGIMDTRKGYMMGSEVPTRENPAGIQELDYRESGGFVPPIGIKEKADDIPAMLSNNEFVFTADAVRAAGGGSVNKGAQKMYALMKQLEGQS